MPSRKKLANIEKGRAIAQFVEYARAAQLLAAKRPRPRLASPPEELPQPEYMAEQLLEPDYSQSAEFYEKAFSELARRFRRNWMGDCFRQQTFEAGYLFHLFSGIAGVFDAIVATNEGRGPFAGENLLRSFPTPARSLRMTEHKTLQVAPMIRPEIAELQRKFIETLEGLDSTRIRRCSRERCRMLFWAHRKDQGCCSIVCARRYRALKWFLEKGKLRVALQPVEDRVRVQREGRRRKSLGARKGAKL
jgi:hypothetical protein